MCLHNINSNNSSRTLNHTPIFRRFQSFDHDPISNCDYLDIADLESQKKSDFLQILQYNVHGISGKRDDLCSLLNKCNIDIAVVCETWLKKNSSCKFTNYTFTGESRVNKSGGGVGFLVRDDLKFRTRDDLRIESKLCENSVIELKTENNSVLLASVYHPPNSNVNEFLKDYNELISNLKKVKNSRLVIGLDHNLDLLKSHKHVQTEDFINLNTDCGLFPTISRPTQITKTSASLIDNIMVDEKTYIDCSSNILVTDLSDHMACHLLLQDVLVERLPPRIVNQRKLNKPNITRIKIELQDINWNLITGHTDCNTSFTKFQEKLLDVVNKHAPERPCRLSFIKKVKEPWLTNSISRCNTKQLELYRKSVVPGATEQNVLEYRNYRNCLRRIKRYSKLLYHNELCTTFKNNTKKLWQIINHASGKLVDKTCATTCLNIEGTLVYEKQMIAQEFAKFFASIGVNYAKKITEDPVQTLDHFMSKMPTNLNSVYFYATNKVEIDKIIMNLKNKSSSGWDGISNKLLKEIKDCILEPLANIFNKSLTEGCFPTAMKEACVIPLFKNKCKTDKNNFRPISLLITISKVLEKIIYKRTYTFFEKHHLLYKSQYGFRANHSCENAIQELVGNIIKGFANDQHTAAIFLDLSKAFDTLDHDILLKKLEKYGIRGVALDWFKSYLNNRKIRVKVTSDSGCNVFSDRFDLPLGTPQGSVLGPLLFLIYTNDLHTHITNSSSILFADDTTLYKSHRNLNYLQWCMEHDLQIVSNWFKAHRLTLNISKSALLFFHCKGKKHSLKLKLGSELIPQQSCTKFLGVWIDDKLTWDAHVSRLIDKLSRGKRLLICSNKLLTSEAKKVLYFAQFQSHLNYGLAVWGNMTKKCRLNKLQKLQDACIKIINGSSTCLGVLNVQNLLDLENKKLGYKLHNNLLPSKLLLNLSCDSTSKTLTKQHHYNTRNKSVLNLPKITHPLYQQSFLYKSIKAIQSVPVATLTLPTVGTFVKYCKTLY